MTDHSAAAVAGITPAPGAKLEPDAIGAAQDTIIGMASSAPAATVGLTFAGLAATTAYGAGPILLLTAIPMLIIANAYRRCNLWKANCGASFEWVGRAINPYLGFLTGWLMIAAYIVGTVAEVLLLGPSVLAVFGSGSTNKWAFVGIGVAMGLIMLVIAVIGIKITARVQVSVALVEYLILVGLAIAGLVWVLSHHAGSVPLSRGWLSVNGIDGKGYAVGGFLAAVFVYGGWDGTLYVNEEVKHRRVNPGRAAILAVALLAVLYTLAQVGFQGVLSPGKLADAANNGTAMVSVAQALGGGFWAKAMALAIALSVIATTGTGIVLGARIVYGMASYRVLPEFLGTVSLRYATPVASSIVVGLLIVVLSAVYFIVESVHNAFNNVIAVTGFLFSIFYILTALAAMTYYRRRIVSGAWDFVTVGLLPLGAAGFLGWVFVKSLGNAPWTQRWSLIGVVIAGLILMLSARFILRSTFFQTPRESEIRTTHRRSRMRPGQAPRD
jgi:amino acid transporter